MERHPDLEAQANFAEAAFTPFAEAEGLAALVDLVDRSKLKSWGVVALRALEICSLVTLDRPDTLRAKLQALRDLLEGTHDELAVEDFTLVGSRHFIGEAVNLDQLANAIAAVSW